MVVKGGLHPAEAFEKACNAYSWHFSEYPDRACDRTRGPSLGSRAGLFSESKPPRAGAAWGQSGGWRTERADGSACSVIGKLQRFRLKLL